MRKNVINGGRNLASDRDWRENPTDSDPHLPFLLLGDNDVLVYRFPFHKRPQPSPALFTRHSILLRFPSPPSAAAAVETRRQAIDARPQSKRDAGWSVGGTLR